MSRRQTTTEKRARWDAAKAGRAHGVSRARFFDSQGHMIIRGPSGEYALHVTVRSPPKGHKRRLRVRRPWAPPGADDEHPHTPDGADDEHPHTPDGADDEHVPWYRRGFRWLRQIFGKD